MAYDIPGFDSTWLLPYFGIQINFATGPNLAPGNMAVLLMGNKLAAGNLVLDTEIRQVFSVTDCDTAGGAASEIALMGRAALAAAPNVSLYLMAVTEVGTAATVTVGFGGGPSTAAGNYIIYINGVKISTAYASGVTFDTVGTAVAAAINASPNCPFTAAYSTPTLTLTSRNKGVRQLDWILYQDTTNASGITYAITGSASVNTVGTVSGVRAGVAGGTGNDSVVSALTKITTQRWARIGVAQNDTTNAALVKAALKTLHGVTVQMYDQAVYGHNNTVSLTQTLSQTTLNDPLSQVYAYRNSETHPALIAAGWAAARAAREAAITGQAGGAGISAVDYDSYNCSAWIAPQRFPSDVYLSSEANALLNAGASPITTVNGVATLTRSVTTYCLNGATQDTRCLDIGSAVIPDQFAIALQAQYQAWRQFTPAVQDNPVDPGTVPSGTGYPQLWDQRKKLVLAQFRDSGLIRDTFSGIVANQPVPPGKYPIASTFNASANRIQGATTIIPATVQHTISEVINEASA